MFNMQYTLLVYVSFIINSFIGINAETRIAIAHLTSETIVGSIQFEETNEGVRVSGTVVGLDAGRYGFHVHELGDISTCIATGAHFNPEGNNHGDRLHDVRHVGDLGNIEFVGNESAVATVDFVDGVISLRGTNSILGRALVLHEQEDDLGLGGHADSLTTGNAGARLACGVIGIKAPGAPWNSAKSIVPSASLLLLAFVLKYF